MENSTFDLKKFKDFLNNGHNFTTVNGIRYTVVEEDYCEVQVELTPDKLNPQHVAHGSLLYTLCDVVTGAASATRGRNMLTQSGTVHYLRTASTGILTAKSKPIFIGRRTALFTAEVYDEENRLLCTGEFNIYYRGDEFDMTEMGQ